MQLQLDENDPPEFPNVDDELAVQRYFEELGLHELNNSKLDNERKFTLALYKLLFQECRFRTEPYEYGGVTLRSLQAGWHRGVKPYQASKQVEAPSKAGKYKQHSACSAPFAVTSVGLPNQNYHCNIWVYLDGRSKAGLPTLYLNVRVEYSLRGVKYLPSAGRWKGEEEIVSDFQLNVSKLGWENVRNDEDQYWDICLPRIDKAQSWEIRFPRPIPLEEPIELQVVPVKYWGWIKDSSEFKAKVKKAAKKKTAKKWIGPSGFRAKAELGYRRQSGRVPMVNRLRMAEMPRVSRLPMAETVTWENSKKYLVQLLYYAISRAENKFAKKRASFTEEGPVTPEKVLGEALKKAVGPEAFGKADLEALEEALSKALEEKKNLNLVFGKARLEALGKAGLEALEEALGKTGLKALGKADLEAFGKAREEAYEKARQEAHEKARLEALGKALEEVPLQDLMAFKTPGDANAVERQMLEKAREALWKAREALWKAREAYEKARQEAHEKAPLVPMVKTRVTQLLEGGETIRKTRRVKKKGAKKATPAKKKAGKKKATKKKAAKKKATKKKAARKKATKKKAARKKATKKKAARKKATKKKAARKKATKKKAARKKATKKKAARKKATKKKAARKKATKKKAARKKAAKKKAGGRPKASSY